MWGWHEDVILAFHQIAGSAVELHLEGVLAPCSVRQLPGQSRSRLAEPEHAVPEVLDPEVPRRVHRRSA
jgi:hypothetical protein